MIGIELTVDGTPIVKRACSAGCSSTARTARVLRLLPALTLTDARAATRAAASWKRCYCRQPDSEPRASATRSTRSSSRLRLTSTNCHASLSRPARPGRRRTHTPAGRGGRAEGGPCSAATDAPLLPGRVLGLVFEKPSLRTRVSFEAAMAQLGGASIFLGANDGRPRPARERARFRPHPQPVRRRRGAADLQPRAPSRSSPRHSAVPGHQRPVRLLPSLPGAGRPAHHAGGVRRRGRAARWSSSATATTWPARWPSAAASWARRFILAAPDGYGFDEPFLQTYPPQAPQGELIAERRPGATPSRRPT